MSLSWRRQLCLSVSPAGVHGLVSSGLRGRVLHHFFWPAAVARNDRAPWASVLDSLRKNLVPRFYDARGATVTVSDHFCHYALLSRSAALDRDAELIAYAQHRIRTSFGEDVDQWDVRLNKSSHGVLVCAIPRGLLDGLRAIFREQRIPVNSIQPNFAAVFNLHRRNLHKRGGWFVVHDEGRAVIGRFDRRRWTALASRRIADGRMESIVSALEREQRLQDVPAEAARDVWLVSSDMDLRADDFAAREFDFTLLDPAFPRVNSEGSPHAMAV